MSRYRGMVGLVTDEGLARGPSQGGGGMADMRCFPAFPCPSNILQSRM